MPSPKATPIHLTDRQRCCLEKISRRQKSEKLLVCRANIILAAADSMTNSQIAFQLDVDPLTVRQWRNRWADAQQRLLSIEAEAEAEKVIAQAVTAVLMDIPRTGSPTTFTAEQIVQIVAISLTPPEESGRPINQWSRRELANEAEKRGIVDTISPRSVGRFLKSSRLKAASQSILAQSQN